VPLYGHLTGEQIMYLGLGAVGSKAIVNPLAKALFKKKVSELDDTKFVQKYFGVIVKGAIAAVAITQSDDENINMIGWGAFAAGALEAAEIIAPAVFAVNGIGTTIDLNDDEWQYLSGAGDSYNGMSGASELGVNGII